MQKVYFRLFSLLLAGAFLLACDNKAADQQLSQPVPFERADECHLCGMAITGFPGPKGQLFEHEVPEVRKFCSTRDLFAYYLQPENSHRVTAIYVHDMSQSPWDKPDDSHLINARDAWYAINHQLSGAMGPTLASFRDKPAAEAFAKMNGGSVVAFSEITLPMLTDLTNNPLESTEKKTQIGEETGFGPEPGHGDHAH